MSTLLEIDQPNPLRTNMVKAAIGAAQRDGAAVIDVATLAPYLPADFGLDADDIADAGYAPAVAEAIAANAVRLNEVLGGGQRVNGAAPPAEPIDPDAIVMAADAAIEAARASKRDAERDVVAARKAFAEALGRWQNTFPKYTPEDNVRDWIKGNNAARAAAAAGRARPQPAPVFGPSKLDRSAGWSGKAAGNADDYTPLQHGHRRAGFPASMRGRRLPPRQ